MSEQRQEREAGVRIVHRADGTGEVNGVTAQPEAEHEAERDVRDAGYLAAVRLGARGRLREVAQGGVRLGGRVSQVGQVRHVSRVIHVGRLRVRPLLHARLPAGAVAACVLVAVLATVLSGSNDPALVRLTVGQENEALHMPLAQAAGRGMAEAAWRGMLAASAGDLGATSDAAGAVPAVPSASPRAQEQRSGVTAADGAAAGRGAGGAVRAAGVSQGSMSVPTAPGPRPAPQPVPAKPPVVTAVTLTLVGSQKSDPNIAYVIMVSTTGPQPLTLTYSSVGYVGGKHGAPVTRSVVLSGRTEYAIADEIASQPYCGGTVTMHASTTPVARNGTVTATRRHPAADDEMYRGGRGRRRHHGSAGGPEDFSPRGRLPQRIAVEFEP